MDYLFVNDKGVWTRQELIDSGVEESSTLKVLVVYDSATNALFVHAVPCKGANDFVVKSVVDCIAWLGHSRVVLRADGDPAMKAIIFEALKGLRRIGQCCPGALCAIRPSDEWCGGSRSQTCQRWHSMQSVDS